MDGGAQCRPSDTPDPLCQGGHANVCEGTSIVHCTAGYRYSTFDCAYDELARTCVVNASGETECVRVPDERCSGVQGSFCAGRTRLRCGNGLLMDEEQCDSECVDADGGGAFCALSGDPATRCAALPEGEHLRFCEGDELITCDTGFARSVITCGAETPCVEEGAYARCFAQ